MSVFIQQLTQRDGFHKDYYYTGAFQTAVREEIWEV